ncbi:MAG: PKD domain-containing protein [Bacteroidetes bacterium]|nr:MAG: PKD domain-containing protein [Bacteroidota bacterium]
MRKILLLIALTVLTLQSKSQDNCAGAVALCANSLITRTTVGATTNGTDPAISCGDNIVNNSVWFTVIAFNNGNCTVTVSNIDNTPGLEMAVYTGSCGSLSPLGPCASGSGSTGRTMSVNFPTIAGTTYYIMVDGTGGNQEAFDILATTSDDAIIARPDANFNTNPSSGCTPLTVLAQNTTILHGGSNITYDWRINAGPYIPASGADTTLLFNTTGTHSLILRVCNTQCGCKTITQEIVVQDLYPSIVYSPPISCVGTDLTFTASADVQPDPPYVDPAITSWDWNFGDPASGAANTATGQVVNHTFNGTATSYTVTLVVQGTCGPDTTQTTVNLRPRPFVDAGPAQIICEGTSANLNAVTLNLVNPITYSWSGPGIFSCDSCSSTDLSNLSPGGPYIAMISVIDSFSCTADTTVEITVNPKPEVDAGSDLQVCPYSSNPLNATPTVGNPPFGFTWSPNTGLDNDAIQNPIATISGPITYCVQITDSVGCMSDPDCLDISIFSPPSINAATPVLCATDPTLQNTFTVSGAAAGSTYEWYLSPDFSLISSSNPDSSSVTVTFPTGIAASYSFTVKVTDAVTGCIDTLYTGFTVTTGLTMAISGPTDLCRDDIATLDASGAVSYNWSASPAYPFADPTLASQNVSPSVSTTFTVTGTAGTCTETIIHTLNVLDKPTANAQPLTPVCGCSTISLDGSGSTGGMIYHWSSVSGNTISDTSALVSSAQACVNDVFTLRVTDPMSGCFMDTSISVISQPKPDANALVSPNLICDGINTVITLDGSGSNTDPGTTYHWSSSNPGAMISDTVNILSSATVSTNSLFFFTVTDAQGCDSVATATVNVYPIPVFISSNPYLCTTDPLLQSTLQIFGAATGSLYDWTSIPPCVTPTSSSFDTETFDFTACGPGSYTFDVRVTDAVNACVNDLSLTIQVVSGVSLNLSGDTTICEGGTVSLNVSGANTFLWNTADTSSTLVIPGLTAVGSPYKYFVTGFIGGCSATDSVEVTVNPVPVTSPINGPLTICAGDTGIYYDVTPSGGNYTWTITGGTITGGQGGSIITVNWDSAGTGSLSVVDTNSFGCPGNTENITVVINALPDSTTGIQGPVTVCENSIETYFVIPNSGSSYSWTVGGGVIQGSNMSDTIQVNWGANGTGSISVFEINSNGCTGPDSLITITINPKPSAPVVLGDQSVCDSSQANYWTGFNSGSNLFWTISGGNITNSSPNNDTISATWTGAGTGTISVHEVNSFGCSSDTTFYSIAVNSQPSAIAAPDSASLCQNASIAISGTATGSTIQWISSGTGTFNDASIASPVYFAGSSDTGYVSLYMIVSAPPCPDDTAGVILYINPSPVVSITGTSNTICFGDNDTLRAQGGGNYLWTPGGSTNATIVVSPPVTTTYYLNVSNSFGCSTADSVTVTVNPPGIPNAGSDQLICRGDSATFYGTQAGGGGYNWTSNGDGTFIPNNSDQQVIYVPGVNDTANGFARIILATTGYCLNLTDTLILQVNDLPVIEAGRDSTITSGSGSGVAIPLRPSILNASGVYWTTSGSGSFSPNDTTFNAQYIPSDDDFTLDSVIITANATGACRIALDFLVIEFTPFAIPNVFTPYPSSPGFNDYFEIRNLPKNTGLKIWDRWGLVVFSTDDYLNNWEAAGLPSEVYYYSLTTAKKEYKGWIQIIRD